MDRNHNVSDTTSTSVLCVCGVLVMVLVCVLFFACRCNNAIHFYVSPKRTLLSAACFAGKERLIRNAGDEVWNTAAAKKWFEHTSPIKYGSVGPDGWKTHCGHIKCGTILRTFGAQPCSCEKANMTCVLPSKCCGFASHPPLLTLPFSIF